jgi:outer membrane protein assembly factor BamB
MPRRTSLPVAGILASLAPALALALAAGGCKKPSRAERCAELRRQMIAIADMIAKNMGGEVTAQERAELEAEARDTEKQCLTWPPEVLECMEPGADPESEKCKNAAAAMSGHVASGLDEAPAGPPVARTAKIADPPVFRDYHVAVAPDGAIITLEKEAISSIAADGTPRWRAELGRVEWMLLSAAGDLVLTGDSEGEGRGALIALSAATGAEAWRATPPTPADVDPYTERQIEAATRLGDKVVLALADGRFFAADLAACAKKPDAPACLQPMFTLTDETLDDPDLIAFGDDLVLGESELIRRLSATGAPRAAIFVRDSYGGIAAAGGDRLAAVIDDELVVLDLAACGGPKAVALPRKPGRMHVRGEGDCDDCARPPTGCVVGRPELGDVDAGNPVVLRDGSIAVGVDAGLARVTRDGVKEWISEVPVVSTVLEAGEHLVGLASGVGDDLDEAPAYAVGLAPATGKVAWRTKLDTVLVSFITSGDDIVAAAGGPWIVLGYKGSIAWLKQP